MGITEEVTQLCHAIQSGTLTDDLLHNVEILNSLSMSGETPLNVAIKNENTDYIIKLLQAKADPNISTVTHVTPIHILATTKLLYYQKGDDILKSMIKAKADINALDPNGFPFIYKVRWMSACQDTLLSKNSGIDIGVKIPPNNESILHKLTGQHLILKIIEQYGDQIDIEYKCANGYTPLHSHCVGNLNDELHVIKTLISLNANVNTTNNANESPLSQLVSLKKINMHKGTELKYIKLLLQANADPNTKCPLTTEQKFGRLTSVPNQFETVLHRAVKACEIGSVSLLLEFGADPKIPDDNGRLPVDITNDPELLATLNASNTDAVAQSICQEISNKSLAKSHLANASLHQINGYSRSGETPLITAIKNENVEYVSLLLASGADPNLPSVGGTVPIHYLAATKMLYYQHGARVLESMIKANADVNVLDSEGFPLLYKARYMSACHQVLLSKSANLNLRVEIPPHNSSVIHKSSGPALIKLLLKKYGNQFDLEKKCALGFTPLHSLCTGNLSEDATVLQTLISMNANVNPVDNAKETPLSSLVSPRTVQDNRIMKYVKILLHAKADPNAKCPLTPSSRQKSASGKFESILHRAAIAGVPAIVSSLLGEGANPMVADDEGHYPIDRTTNAQIKSLLLAHEANSENTVTQLICTQLAHNDLTEQKINLCSINDINGRGQSGDTPLILAIKLQNVTAIKALLKAKADPNICCASNQTPLLTMANSSFLYYNNNLTALESLLEAKANVNAVGPDGQTLHTAILHKAPCHELLIKYNLDINLQFSAKQATIFHHTALHFLHTLNKFGIQPNVNIRDIDGDAPLHTAITSTREYVELLINNNADLNARNNAGHTPLSKLIVSRSPDQSIIKTLLKSGADANSIHQHKLSPNGVTLLHLAQTEGICKLLINYRADIHYADSIYRITAFLNKASPPNTALIHFFINIGAKKLDGSSILHDLILQGNFKRAFELLRLGISVESQDCNTGNTPLHLAVNKGHAKLVEFLIIYNSSITIKNGEQLTPLMLAIATQQLNLIKLIVSFPCTSTEHISECIDFTIALSSCEKKPEILAILQNYLEFQKPIEIPPIIEVPLASPNAEEPAGSKKEEPEEVPSEPIAEVPLATPKQAEPTESKFNLPQQPHTRFDSGSEPDEDALLDEFCVIEDDWKEEQVIANLINAKRPRWKSDALTSICFACAEKFSLFNRKVYIYIGRGITIVSNCFEQIASLQKLWPYFLPVLFKFSGELEAQWGSCSCL